MQLEGKPIDKVTTAKLKEIEEFFDERVLGWMINDLKESVEAGTNYLTALGCLTYTEAVGLFLPPLPNESGSPNEKRFYRCLFRFPSKDALMDLDCMTRSETSEQRGLYQHLRHSGAHSYFFTIKKYHLGQVLFYPVGVVTTGRANDGSLSAPMGTDKEDGFFCIATKNYVQEFEASCKEFRKRICEDKDESWVKSGIQGIDYMLRGVVPTI